jgi:two-component system LytT family response regulator
MKKLSALLVDDEKGVRELLRHLIEKHCPELNIIGEAGDADAAYELIISLKPDLVFLDIQMPRADGFSLLRRFENPDFDVIISTSYAEYAIWAFKANAVDYLMKPYDIKELKEAIKKVVTKRELVQAAKQNTDIFLWAHKKDNVEQISAKSILYLEASNNYTQVVTSNNEKYMLSKVLADVEELLSSSSSFIRINRSIILNRHYIKNYTKNPPYTITLENDLSFEISRRRRSEIMELLKGR